MVETWDSEPTFLGQNKEELGTFIFFSHVQTALIERQNIIRRSLLPSQNFGAKRLKEPLR